MSLASILQKKIYSIWVWLRLRLRLWGTPGTGEQVKNTKIESLWQTIKYRQYTHPLVQASCYCMQIFFFRSSFVCYRLWLVSYIYIYISYLWLIQFIWFIYKFFKFLLIVRYKYTFIELSNFTSFFIWGREGGGRRIYLWTQVPKSCSFGTLKQ